MHLVLTLWSARNENCSAAVWEQAMLTNGVINASPALSTIVVNNVFRQRPAGPSQTLLSMVPRRSFIMAGAHLYPAFRMAWRRPQQTGTQLVVPRHACNDSSPDSIIFNPNQQQFVPSGGEIVWVE